MAGVTYGLARFDTGSHILDLPVLEGASWSATLNRADSLSCAVDMRDPDVQALNIPSSTEPKKTVLFASNDEGIVLAWGVVSDREWDDDARELTINASGGAQYFAQRIIAPPGAETGALVDAAGKVVTTYDTTLSGLTLGSIGKRLVEQALSWPGSPTAFVLPADVAGTATRTYRLTDYKRVGPALDDLTKTEDGPDFAFDARLAASGLALEYVMRIGDPFLGTYAGSWEVGGPLSPVSKLKVSDDGARLATHIWMQSGRTDSKVLVSRARNASLLSLSGYPVLDLVDTTHGDVSVQATLDAYAAELAGYSGKLQREVTFTVKGNAALALGQYRPGDWASLDVAEGNLYLAAGEIPIRILGMSGNETGEDIKITCAVGVMP